MAESPFARLPEELALAVLGFLPSPDFHGKLRLCNKEWKSGVYRMVSALHGNAITSVPRLFGLTGAQTQPPALPPLGHLSVLHLPSAFLPDDFGNAYHTLLPLMPRLTGLNVGIEPEDSVLPGVLRSLTRLTDLCLFSRTSFAISFDLTACTSPSVARLKLKWDLGGRLVWRSLPPKVNIVGLFERAPRLTELHLWCTGWGEFKAADLAELQKWSNARSFTLHPGVDEVPNLLVDEARVFKGTEGMEQFLRLADWLRLHLLPLAKDRTLRVCGLSPVSIYLHSDLSESQIDTVLEHGVVPNTAVVKKLLGRNREHAVSKVLARHSEVFKSCSDIRELCRTFPASDMSASLFLDCILMPFIDRETDRIGGEHYTDRSSLRAKVATEVVTYLVSFGRSPVYKLLGPKSTYWREYLLDSVKYPLNLGAKPNGIPLSFSFAHYDLLLKRAADAGVAIDLDGPLGKVPDWAWSLPGPLARAALDKAFLAKYWHQIRQAHPAEMQVLCSEDPNSL